MGQIVLDRDTHERVTLLANAWDVTPSQAIGRLVSMFAKGKAEASADKSAGRVVVHAIYEGTRVEATFDPSAGVLTITDGPLAGERFRSPSRAARAVVAELKPSVSPHRNGWIFWIVSDTGQFLQSIRR